MSISKQAALISQLSFKNSTLEICAKSIYAKLLRIPRLKVDRHQGAEDPH